MSTVASNRPLVDIAAVDLAFRVGQLTEQLLIDGGIDRAAQAGSPVVTAEHVRSSFDRAMLDHILQIATENPHGTTAGSGRQRTGASREAA